jgi:hypothetical protein
MNFLSKITVIIKALVINRVATGCVWRGEALVQNCLTFMDDPLEFYFVILKLQ